MVPKNYFSEQNVLQIQTNICDRVVGIKNHSASIAKTESFDALNDPRDKLQTRSGKGQKAEGGGGAKAGPIKNVGDKVCFPPTFKDEIPLFEHSVTIFLSIIFLKICTKYRIKIHLRNSKYSKLVPKGPSP